MNQCDMQIGKRLKMFREKKGLTQLELAKALDVTEKAVSSWEVGRSFPRLDKLYKISDFFSVCLAELLGEYSLSYEEEVVIKTYRSLSEDQKKSLLIKLMSFELDTNI